MMRANEFLGLTRKRAREFAEKASRPELERMLNEIYEKVRG